MRPLRPFLAQLQAVATMMAAHGRLHIEESDFQRTITIDTFGIRNTEFRLSTQRAVELYEPERAVAEGFLISEFGGQSGAVVGK